MAVYEINNHKLRCLIWLGSGDRQKHTRLDTRETRRHSRIVVEVLSLRPRPDTGILQQRS